MQNPRCPEIFPAVLDRGLPRDEFAAEGSFALQNRNISEQRGYGAVIKRNELSKALSKER